MKKIFDEHPQSFFKSLGDNACYVFCIINVAEQFLHASFSMRNRLDFIMIFINEGWVRFNYENCLDQGNFFVVNPSAMLKEITGTNWKIEMKKADEVSDVPKYAVEKWKNGAFSHFCRRYIGFDPMEYSNTVANGKIESYRIFTPIE